MYLGALMFEWLRLLMSEHNMIITDVRLIPITNLKYSRHLPKGMGYNSQFVILYFRTRFHLISEIQYFSLFFLFQLHCHAHQEI